MVPIIPVPNVQTPPPVQQSVLTGVSSDVAIGRMPYNAVGASVALPELQYNNRGLPPFRSNAANTSSSANVGGFSGLASGTPSPLGGGFSSLFMAQLLGQSSGSDSEKLVSFFNGSLNLDTLLDFGLVKYKPSMAAFPRPKPSFAPPVQVQASVPEPASVKPQAAATPPVVAESDAPPAPVVKAAEATEPMDVAVISQASVQVAADKPEPRPISRNFRSNFTLAKTSGFNAYLATFARNATHLGNGPEYNFAL